MEDGGAPAPPPDGAVGAQGLDLARLHHPDASTGATAGGSRPSSVTCFTSAADRTTVERVRTPSGHETPGRERGDEASDTGPPPGSHGTAASRPPRRGLRGPGLRGRGGRPAVAGRNRPRPGRTAPAGRAPAAGVRAARPTGDRRRSGGLDRRPA